MPPKRKAADAFTVNTRTNVQTTTATKKRKHVLEEAPGSASDDVLSSPKKKTREVKIPKTPVKPQVRSRSLFTDSEGDQSPTKRVSARLSGSMSPSKTTETRKSVVTTTYRSTRKSQVQVQRDPSSSPMRGRKSASPKKQRNSSPEPEPEPDVSPSEPEPRTRGRKSLSPKKPRNPPPEPEPEQEDSSLFSPPPSPEPERGRSSTKGKAKQRDPSPSPASEHSPAPVTRTTRARNAATSSPTKKNASSSPQLDVRVTRGRKASPTKKKLAAQSASRTRSPKKKILLVEHEEELSQVEGRVTRGRTASPTKKKLKERTPSPAHEASDTEVAPVVARRTASPTKRSSISPKKRPGRPPGTRLSAPDAEEPTSKKRPRPSSPSPSPKKKVVTFVSETEAEEEASPAPPAPKKRKITKSTASEEEEDTVELSPRKKDLDSRCSSPIPTNIQDLNSDVLDLSRLTSLPPNYHPHLRAQKHTILRSIRSRSSADGGNESAKKDLSDLLKGTVERCEGNSCFVVGPRGCGKTFMVEECIKALEPKKPIVIRLSGWVQSTDRMAMKEIAVQLYEQTGKKADLPEEDQALQEQEEQMTLPPSTLLPLLLTNLRSLASTRPIVIILDALELFLSHPRQSLLYCLFDTCQQGNGGAFGVVGVGRDVRVVEGLEKRVKSRFSGRTFWAGREGDGVVDYWRELFLVRCGDDEEWNRIWEMNVRSFFEKEEVLRMIKETGGLTKDVRVLERIMTTLTIHLTPTQPSLTPTLLRTSIITQRSRPPHPFLKDLSYSHLLLLIASYHNPSDLINFEMLHESITDAVRSSSSAPITLKGAGLGGSGGMAIGMKRVARGVLWGAFEQLVKLRVFVQGGQRFSGDGKEWVKYRCVVERGDLKEAVMLRGEMELKRWIGRGGAAK